MNKETLLKKLETITNLPTLPAVMHKLGAAVRNPNADAELIAKIIKDDPSMMTRILKVVNSAAYAGGSGDTIVSIQQAVARMGFVAVQNIALSTSLFSTFDKTSGTEFNREEFWRHSICTGIAANVLYEHIRENCHLRIPKDVLHLSGLLHDIGKIVFDQFFHFEFMEAIRMSGKNQIPLFQAERETLGADHTEVGFWLVGKWNLSKEVSQVIQWHHDPEKADEKYLDLVRLCHTANHICNLEKMGYSGDTVAPSFVIGVWRRLGLKVRDIQDIVKEIIEESSHSETLLSFMKA